MFSDVDDEDCGDEDCGGEEEDDGGSGSGSGCCRSGGGGRGCCCCCCCDVSMHIPSISILLHPLLWPKQPQLRVIRHNVGRHHPIPIFYEGLAPSELH